MTPSPSRFPLSRAAAALAVALSLAWPAFGQPSPSPQLDRLAETAALQGSVRVIVGLALPTQPEGLLPAAAVLQQRANIRAAQNAVVARLLGGTASTAHALFDTIPFLAAEVDSNAMARLRTSPLVADIQEDHLASTSLKESVPLIHSPAAWAAGHAGTDWAVAVLDTGVDKVHPFLAGKVVSEACYSTTSESQGSVSLCPGGASSSEATGSAVPCAGYCEHGTHVAGIAAGTGAAGGFDGVAKGAGVVAVQVFSLFPDYYGAGQGEVLSYSSDQIRGLERVYALAKTLKIAAVNMSLGGGKYSRTCDLYYGATKSIIDNLRSAGVATVIAAGNDGWKTSISGPACISTAVSVGATCDVAGGSYCATGVDGVASYSNIASFVSLVAPGSYITSSVPGAAYATWSGTSMATPHVAGAWAVLKQAQPTLTVTDALAQFRANAVTVSDTRPGGSVTGLKRVDLAFVGAAPQEHQLSVALIKSGAKANGSVTSSPAGISCGSTCVASFAEDSTVKLTAKATGGSKFVGWDGACSAFTTTTTCTLTMSGDLAVTATFKK